MDFGNIIYLIAVIGYFIYQISKNRKSGQSPEGTEQEGETPSRPTTFEDLMREIREAQNPEAAKPKPQAPKPEPVYQDRRYQREEKVDDEISYYDGAYEKAKSAAQKAVPISQIDFSDVGPDSIEPVKTKKSIAMLN